jgi:succinate dehydrogenase flavin-adding protein (antitoxin of CptAB toxin-antitoxin module)
MNKKIDRKQQLEKLRWRSRQRGKEGKSLLFDEFCEQYGFERKYPIKLLGNALPRLIQSPDPVQSLATRQ